MSGGVDSSVAALCLRDAGYDVAGVTMRLKPRHMLNDAQAAAVEKEIADAAAVCAKLGIEHFAPDFSAAFEENVIGAFVSAYKNGETPNPCFRCNQTIKFGVMLDWALAHGFDKIATGHYAEIVEEGGRTKLKRSPDQKDQSYFLSGLTPAQLSRTLLPLNRMGKAETRALAQQHGLPVAQKFFGADPFVRQQKPHAAAVFQGFSHGRKVFAPIVVRGAPAVHKFCRYVALRAVEHPFFGPAC